MQLAMANTEEVGTITVCNRQFMLTVYVRAHSPSACHSLKYIAYNKMMWIILPVHSFIFIVKM